MASHIGRRKFLATLGGAVAAWPLAARAQQGDRVRLLAAMMGGRNADTDLEGRAWVAAFRQGLQELGWVEGRNFRADYRWPSGDLDRMRAIAKEFVDLKPDVPSTEGVLPASIREHDRYCAGFPQERHRPRCPDLYARIV